VRKTPAACVFAALLAAGCSRQAPGRTLTLATTTSVQDTGLLDVLLPLFKERTGIEVKPVAVGTGQALELGRRGDADVLLVHDPDAEQRFMDEGHGALRRVVMHNDFVLVGPPDDPAGVRGEPSVTEAFARVARRQAPFVSRGDESGTHRKEQAVWRRAQVEPAGGWYVQGGGGMAQTLRLADEKRAYTLTDRGTYLSQQKSLDLAVLCEGDPVLVNVYSVIVVSPEKHPDVKQESARKFADFLLSDEGRRVIADFGRDRLGQPLFIPGGPGAAEPPR
jgi:tungstate transport system substrate-binding protein